MLRHISTLERKYILTTEKKMEFESTMKTLAYVLGALGLFGVGGGTIASSTVKTDSLAVLQNEQHHIKQDVEEMKRQFEKRMAKQDIVLDTLLNRTKEIIINQKKK